MLRLILSQSSRNLVRILPSSKHIHTSPILFNKIGDQGSANETPWYLRNSDVLTQIERPAIPEVPEGSPVSLGQFLELISNDYGLDDIKLYDLSLLDPDHPNSIQNQPADYMIIATGKSEKHVHKAGTELKFHIKHTFGHIPRISGLVSSVQSPLTRRRMLKRANKGPVSTDNEYGRAANSWIMCETAVDNIFIHVLTKERRQELDLESLWVNEQIDDLFTRQHEATDMSLSTPGNSKLRNSYIHPESDLSKDSSYVPYFFQSRRFHTSTRLNNINSVFDNLLGEKVNDLDESALKTYIQTFETEFTNPKLEDYNLKSQFYGILHMINSQIITFDDVTRVLLEKYNDIQLGVETDLKQQRVLDLVTYMRLILDSPELKTKYQGKAISDNSLDLLAKFAMKVYRFSGHNIDVESVPEFIPLLISLSTITEDQGIYLGPSTIDDTIYNEKNFYDTKFLETHHASNRARDVFDLINYYLELRSETSTLSRSTRELVLFIYGNSGKWQEFWEHWNVSMNFLDNQNDIIKWVRLIVYLALRNDANATQYFIENYWNSPDSLSGSFLDVYNSHQHELKPQEVEHLRLALNKLASSTKSAPEEMRTFIESL